MGKNFSDTTMGGIVEGAAGGVIGAGMGLLLEGHNDRRQRRQQQALTDMQSKANKQLAAFNYDQQMKMWENTNYSAQMAQLEKAGLNPGLIYGMSGGGGATTNAAQAAGVSGGSAQGNSGEAMGMMMNKIQMEMMKTQMENIAADTEKKKVETEKTAGVDTQEATSRIELQSVQKQIGELEKEFLSGTMEDRQRAVGATMDKIGAELIQLEQSNQITSETLESQVTEIKQRSVNAIILGQAMKQGIEVDKAAVNKMAEDIAQGWSKITIDKFRAEIEANFKGLDKIAGNLIEMIFQKIDDSTGTKQNRTPNKIK